MTEFKFDTLDDKLASQLPGAPFPEDSAIPSEEEGQLEVDGKPNAFGSADTAAPLGVEDAVIEGPKTEAEIAVDYVGAAKQLGLNDASNEFDNSSLTVEPAQSTNAETIEAAKQQEDPAPRRRGRRSNAEKAADEKAAAEKAAADKVEDGKTTEN